MMMECWTRAPRAEVWGGGEMRTPDEVSTMMRLRALGWGTKRIAAELGCSRNTVKRYIEARGWTAYRRPKRERVFGRAVGVAGGAVPPASRQRRRGASGL